MASLPKIAHAERAHALLSASGSERWINCPASPRLEEVMPEEASVYADEGTLAHELADIKLRTDLKFMSMDNYRQQVELLRKHPLYYPAMEDEVMEYVNYCKAQFTEAKRIDKHARILIEEKLDLTEWIADGFGTSDCIVISNVGIEVIDLKFGKGKQVYAEENTQLKTYGLGAERVARRTTTFNKVTLTIVQPRLEHLSSWSLSTKELKDWGEQILKPKAVEAYKGDGPQVPGDWCQFCKVRPRCKALSDMAMEQVRRDFEEQDDPRLINDDELLTLYKNADFISKFLSDVKGLVLKQAIEGKQWQGFKLVEGRSNRVITDESKAIQILTGELYTTDEILNKKLKGLGDLEKLLKKAEFNSLLGHLVVKPAGAPTLVDENDKRELYGVSRIAKDFEIIADVEDEDDDLN